MQHHPVASTDATHLVNSLQAAGCEQSAPLTVAPDEAKETALNSLKQVNQGSSVDTPHEIDRAVQETLRTGSSWVFVYDTLNSEIKIRHYSPKTLKSYRSWARHFQPLIRDCRQRIFSV